MMMMIKKADVQHMTRVLGEDMNVILQDSVDMVRRLAAEKCLQSWYVSVHSVRLAVIILIHAGILNAMRRWMKHF